MFDVDNLPKPMGCPCAMCTINPGQTGESIREQSISGAVAVLAANQLINMLISRLTPMVSDEGMKVLISCQDAMATGASVGMQLLQEMEIPMRTFTGELLDVDAATEAGAKAVTEAVASCSPPNIGDLN